MSTCPDPIENIYFLDLHSFQASFHQYLHIQYIFFIFFQVLLNDDSHFALVPKYFTWGRFVVTSFSTYDHNMLPFCLYSYVLPPLFTMCDCGLKPHHTKTFEESSNRGSTMPPRLNQNRELMICGIVVPCEQM